MAPGEIYLSGALSKSSLRLTAYLCFSGFDQVGIIFTCHVLELNSYEFDLAF